MVRNAAIAAGNSGLPELVPVLRAAGRRRGRGGRRSGALGAGRGSASLLLPAERGDAGGAVHVAAVGQAGVDMGDDRLAAARAADRDRRRARRPGPRNWSLRALPFAHVEIGLAEQGDQGAGVAAHHAFEADAGCRRRRRRDDRRGASAGRRDAARQQALPASSRTMLEAHRHPPLRAAQGITERRRAASRRRAAHGRRNTAPRAATAL